ncbi:hypothetical protein MMC07_004056 [Pseudocyphellaria aurata]|nr:hypothetical protein [Pseudocyphellaria aurata]
MFMELPVSGLHRLFHTTPSLLSSTSTSARAPTTLESVTEDAHTYDLLYPEPSTLRQTQHHAYPLKNGDPSSAALAATSHDDWGGLDIQSPEDVRILIAQDGNALAQLPRVLYDSQPPSPPPATRHAHSSEGAEGDDVPGGLPATAVRRRNTSALAPRKVPKAQHERRSSFAQIPQSYLVSPTSPSSPEAEFRGAFSNPKLRRSSLRPTAGGGESTQSRVARERREETEALLGCMFGSTGLPLVSSTKLHIKPAGSGITSNGVTSPVASEIPRGVARRRTPLTRSTTLEELHSFPPPGGSGLAEDAGHVSRPNHPSILITRIFSVDSANSIPLPNHANPEPENPNPQPDTFKDQQCQNSSVSAAKTEKAKQVKTPTYAVAIVLQLPADRHRPFTSSLHEPSPVSTYGHERLSQSPRQMGHWTWEDSTHPYGYISDTDRDIENVIDHWNLLNRVASSLETVAQEKIRDLLRTFEANQTRLPVQSPAKAADIYSNTKQKRLKQPSQRTIQLPSDALQHCAIVQKEAEMAGKRVALALKIRKVIAGQGRWGIWREEARWIEKWAGKREQNFFFFNLLTAFLGTHTEWLDMLGPSWYRRRHVKQAQQSRRDVSIIQHRTVIVSSDKMAARRLIFLLSAFLPSTYVNPALEDGCRPHSPWSSAGYSQSPPSGISVLRQQSLRRTINRRQRGNRAIANSRRHGRGVSFSGQDSAFTEGLNGATDPGVQQHGRRASDARSIRSLPLPISPSESTRKSSSTTTGTAIYDTSIPVPHFSSLSPESLLGTSAEARPGSSGSFASLSLKHTLTRSEGTDHSNNSTDSQSVSRWGSMISGFWSTRRGSSTDGSDALSPQEGLGISGLARDRRGSRPLGRLAQMVEEVDKPLESKLGAKALAVSQGPTSVPKLQDVSTLPEQSTPARNIPERPKIEQFPMKLSIDRNDGVVDVDLRMPNSFSSSFASSMSSPKATHTGASSFNDSSLYGRNSSHEAFQPTPESTVDVAGWLKGYHQDFSLQAVRPYKELKDDIIRSMRFEPIQIPTPFAGDPALTPWMEVCTTLIADAQDFSVTRISLRRRLVPTSTSPTQSTTTQFSNNSSSAVEEEIISEKIMDLDATLIDAVERVLAHSTHSSRAHSRTVSPSRPDEGSVLEVPRSECRRLVLGALEQVAKSVGEEQSGRGRDVRPGAEGERGVGLDSTLREGVRKWLNGGAGVV